MQIIMRKTYGKIFLVLFCTIIGGYGIFTAPESDKKILEQELIQNQQMLQQVNSVAQAKTKPLAEAEPQTIKKGSRKEKEKTVSVIGDSIFLGAAPSFQKIQKNTFIDAKISRQVYQGI